MLKALGFKGLGCCDEGLKGFNGVRGFVFQGERIRFRVSRSRGSTV